LSENSAVLDVSEKGLSSSLALRFGFAHRMRDAIILSGQYMKEMREIFIERGLPEELTIIPFVESSFSPRAFSSAGAAGIWQFIEQTGRNYLRIDEFVDERYDPILSTYAAASHLSREYALLKAWPLTINAYNTGPGRILDAIEKLGTRDIAKIIKNYKGSGYGFDSRNYFPEFLAALEIYNNREHYFGALRVLPPQGFEYIAMPFAVNIKELLRLTGVSDKVVANINLTLRDDVLMGEKNLPKGYLLKVPAQTKEDFLIALQELYSETRLATHHMVDKGELLKDIAKLYGVSTEKLTKINGLLPGHKVKQGDILMLPVIDDNNEMAKEE
jgi:membrane-bound lytic murein transglycosylase D